MFWGFTEKSNFRVGGGFTNTQYRGEDCLKKGGLGQFADLRGGLARKRGGGGELIPKCTQCLVIFFFFHYYYYSFLRILLESQITPCELSVIWRMLILQKTFVIWRMLIL